MRKPGRAEAALQPVALPERLLQRMHARPRGASPSTVVTSCPSACTASSRQERTGCAVEQHRARPADAVLAPHVGAGEPQVVAQEVRQQAAGRHARIVSRTVDHQPHVVEHVGLVRGGCGWCAHAAARPAAWARARAVSTPTRWLR